MRRFPYPSACSDPLVVDVITNHGRGKAGSTTATNGGIAFPQALRWGQRSPRSWLVVHPDRSDAVTSISNPQEQPMPPDTTITLSGEPGTAHVFSTVAAQRGEVQTIDLKPAYTSLGLPASAFKPEFRGSDTGKAFDAAVGGGVVAPDVVWLFQGADYIRVNLRSKAIERPPTPILVGWAPGGWPATFPRRIHPAVSFT